MTRHHLFRFMPFVLVALLLTGVASFVNAQLPAEGGALSAVNGGETNPLGVTGIITGIVTDAGQYVHLDTEFASPFTVRSVVHIGPDFDKQVEQLHVLGLAADPEGDPDVLSLVWERDVRGWWPTWQLALTAGPDVILNGAAGGNVGLGQIVPTPGHTYEAVLSYDEAMGGLSLAVTDVTEGRALVNESFQAAGLPPAAWLRVGARGAHEPWTWTPAAAEVISLTGEARFVPVGARWTRMIQSADGTTLAAQRVHAGEHLLITLDTPSVPPRGSFRIVIADAVTGHPVLLQDVSPQQTLRIPGRSLPLGVVDVQLVYADEEGELVLDERALQVGHLGVLVHQVVPDPVAGVVRGVAQITSPAAVDGIPFRLTATVSRRLWNGANGTYEDHPYAQHVLLDTDLVVPAGEPVTIPFSVPYPESPGTWRLTAQAETPMSHTLHTSGGLHLFDTDMGENKSGDVSLRVCTYNVYGFDGFPQDAARRALGGAVTPQRIDHFIGVMRELDCDITALQEANSVAWIQVLANGLDYNMAVSSTRTRFPGGVLTPYPILETRDYATGGQANNVPYSRTAGAALLDIDGRPVWVVNLHAHPNEESLRVQEARILGEKVDELLAISPYMIVLGDFNSVPGGVIHKALTDRGFVNTMELAADMYTPTMNRQEGGTGTRAIDHIYVSESLTGTVRRSWVVSDPGFRMPDRPDADHWLHSDHLPVAAELKW